MGKNEVKVVTGEGLSWLQALHTANEYYALSSVFTDRYAESWARTDGSTNSMAGVASATNRCLAIELYFKALLIATRQPIPWDHDLLNLFQLLPATNRDLITALYDPRRQTEHSDSVWSIEFAFQIGNKMSNEHSRTLEDKRLSLSALLERNRNGFVASRYLFQDSVSERISFFVYEFRALGILCEIMRDGFVRPAREFASPGNFL